MSTLTAIVLFNSIAIIANTIVIAYNSRVIMKVANDHAELN